MTLGELNVEKAVINKGENVTQQSIITPLNNAVPGDKMNGIKMYENQVR